MLKVGGLWVSPIDMEHVLIEHPRVDGVGVVGVTADGATPDRGVRRVRRRRPATTTLADELQAWCKERMRRYEYPHMVRVRRRPAANADRQGAALPPARVGGRAAGGARRPVPSLIRERSVSSSSA